jgi:hypothetical protein
MGQRSGVGKGIRATRASQKFFRFENIEDIAKDHGIYSFEELYELIKTHSPIKDSNNFYLCKIIHDAMRKDKKLSFHAACVENMPYLSILLGEDPTKIHYGWSWYQNKKKKNKGIKQSDFPREYTKVIDTISLRWKRLYKKNNKTFMGWYQAQTKASTAQMLQFLGQTLRYLENKKSK